MGGTQVLHVKLDEALRQIFGEERLPLRRVSERRGEMATQEEPIEIMYALKLQGEPKPMVFEALVQVEDPVLLPMRDLVQVPAPCPLGILGIHAMMRLRLGAACPTV